MPSSFVHKLSILVPLKSQAVLCYTIWVIVHVMSVGVGKLMCINALFIVDVMSVGVEKVICIKFVYVNVKSFTLGKKII